MAKGVSWVLPQAMRRPELASALLTCLLAEAFTIEIADCWMALTHQGLPVVPGDFVADLAIVSFWAEVVSIICVAAAAAHQSLHLPG